MTQAGDKVAVIRSSAFGDREAVVAIGSVKTVERYRNRTRITLSDDSHWDAAGGKEWKRRILSTVWHRIEPLTEEHCFRFAVEKAWYRS